MISQAVIKTASDLILFGSYARGEATDDSDLDLLIIRKEVLDKRAEMVQARRLLSPLRIPVDVLVASEDQLNSSWKDYPGTYLYEAIREGVVLYEME
jgi:predicted nucleotidyltransferase